MNLEKLKRFGELQNKVYEMSEGRFPLVTFLHEQDGISVHNPFVDTSRRFEVDPIKEYGEEKLAFMEAEIEKIETKMEIGVDEMEVNDLLLYLGGKFYQGKEPRLDCFEKISFEDEPMFIQNKETNISESLNFYVPLFKGFEELLPEAALAYVVPKNDQVEVNLYLDYNIASKEISLSYVVKNGDSPDKEGSVKIPEEAKEGLLAKMDAYVKEQGEESLEKMVSEVGIASKNRIIKISAGLTQEYEVFRTNAPDEIIIEQIRENNRMSEEDVLIENPYGVLEKNGYFVDVIGCQYDDDLMEEIVIDAEFDSYQIKPDSKGYENSKMEYPVFLVSAGGAKKEFSVRDTKQEAIDLCEQYGWEYKDENDFVWGMEYDEREKEKPSLDAMLKEAAGCVCNSSAELQNDKGIER